jgi:hypothetical protein
MFVFSCLGSYVSVYVSIAIDVALQVGRQFLAVKMAANAEDFFPYRRLRAPKWIQLRIFFFRSRLNAGHCTRIVHNTLGGRQKH